MTQEDIQSVKQHFGIIGTHSQLNRAIEVAVQVAMTDLSVLVTGESGVGKEFFPQIIHSYSSRKHGPYIPINCGAIPEGTIDSELFGHEKGAFTDAKADRKGYFEIADGGTLFLDEVGELPMQTQVRLLRVLERGEFIRVGASKIQKTNVRVVAATNIDMPRAIREGRFREDLYYRLSAVAIKVPSLRERKEDIPLLFRKFVRDFCEKYHMPALRLNEEANQLLMSYYWQGNVRQLKNVAEQICILETNHDITPETLRQYLPQNENSTALVLGNAQRMVSEENFMNERELLYKILFDMKQDIADLRRRIEAQSEQNNPSTYNPTTVQTASYTGTPAEPTYQIAEEVKEEPHSMMDMEREAIRNALIQNGNNRRAAAASLNMPERTFYRKIKEYGL